MVNRTFLADAITLNFLGPGEVLCRLTALCFLGRSGGPTIHLQSQLSAEKSLLLYHIVLRVGYTFPFFAFSFLKSIVSGPIVQRLCGNAGEMSRYDTLVLLKLRLHLQFLFILLFDWL